MNLNQFAKVLTAMTYDGPRYIRRPRDDKRFGRGDDYAGDAWLDTLTGRVVWTVVGYDANRGDAYMWHDGGHNEYVSR